MKIEKLNDNQIRCTLNKDDLADRELRISELAYGTEKAKALFRDMMQQASYEFGFEAEDIPLMIEAIPISSESLILVITKVEDPDELDTRFSKFTKDGEEDTDFYTDDLEEDSYADEIISSFEQLDELEETSAESDFIPLPQALTALSKVQENKDTKNIKEKPITTNLTKIYSFKSLDDVIRLSSILGTAYNGENSLYKNSVTSIYYLIINKSDHTPEEFNKVCNVLSEYGKSEKSTYASPSFFKEHFDPIVKDVAIQVLSAM